MFKLKCHFALLLSTGLFFYSCSSADDTQVVNEDTENPVSINFTVGITSPDAERDYSHHNGGTEGIYDNPENEKPFSAKIVVPSYQFNSVSYTDFTVRWTSDIDGMIYEGNPDEFLKSDITTFLSKGVHKVKIEAFLDDYPEIIKKDSIMLSNVIKLEASSTGNSVQLNWTKYEGDDFISYLIYKDAGQPIAEITNIDQLFYEDTQYELVVEEKQYQVVVNTTTDYNYTLGSNFVQQPPGIVIKVPHYISKVIRDPVQNKIYAIPQDKQNNIEEDFGLIVINTETFTIEDHILKEHKFLDMDISPDGQNLYLVRYGIGEIVVVNLATLTTSTVTAPTSWGFHKIEATAGDYLICHQHPPTSGNSDVWIVNKYTGSHSYTVNHRHGDIEYNHLNNSLYLAESNTTGGRLLKRTFTNGSLNYFPAIFPDGSGITYPQPFLLISDDYNHLFWEYFQLDMDLNMIRQFPTRIIACSPTNTYLADNENLYYFNSLAVAYEYPQLPIHDKTNVTFLDEEKFVLTIADNNNYTHLPETTYFIKLNLP